MNPALPQGLADALDALLEGVSRKELAVRAQAISQRYRDGRSSGVAIASAEDAIAYAVARLPATYAVTEKVLDEVRRSAPAFAPRTMLDVGAGPGTARWAARETWPALSHVTLSDSNAHFRNLSRALAPPGEAAYIARDLVRDLLPEADLVIAGYVLAEVAPRDQHDVIVKLFAAASDVLVLIEPGTPAGFERIRAARGLLVEQGAQILGPCTHANACPMTGTDWCHFSQRLPRSRDHLLAKDACVPFEDERFSWIAVSRTRRSDFAGQARVLAPPNDSKPGIMLKLCTPDGLESRLVARRDREVFAALRRVRWGDIVVV